MSAGAGRKAFTYVFESGAVTTLKNQLDAQMLLTQKKEMLVLLVWLLPYTYHVCHGFSSQRHLKRVIENKFNSE